MSVPRGPLLVAVLLAAFLPFLGGGPVYDDEPSVLSNPATRDPGALLKDLAGWPPHRGLTEASFLLARGKAGNLLLHAGASLLALWIARKAGAGAWAAFWFALHPLGAQVVAYLSQRAACLEAALAFLCLALFLKAKEGSFPWRGPWAWASLAAGLLAMGAKETAVTVPLLLAAAAWILRAPGESPRAALRILWPFLLLPALGALKALATGSFRPVPLDASLGEVQLSPLSYLLQQPPVVLRYARLAAFPFPLGFYHDRVFGSPALPALLAGSALLAAGVWSLLGPDRHRLPRLGVALFLAPLALECSVFPILDPAWNHRAYPGLLGGGLVFAWAAARFPLAAVLALGLLGAGTSAECRLWSDLGGLMRRDVRQAWHVEVVWANQAWRALQDGRPEGAERLCRRGAAGGLLNPKLETARAAALHALGRTEESRGILDGLRRAFPGNAKTLWQAVRQAEGEGDGARLDDLAGQASGIRPLRHAPLLLWTARRLAARHGPGRAEALLEANAPFHDGSGELWDHLGWVRFAQGKDGPAEAAYRKALALEPGLLKARFNLASLLSKRGDRAGAARELREALRRDPSYAKAREALARLEASP